MSRFIVDIVLWEEKANEFCLPPLTKIQMKKSFQTKGIRLNHSPQLHTSPVDSQQQISAAMPRTQKIQLLKCFFESIRPLLESYNA
jgi:hypothetical protein